MFGSQIKAKLNTLQHINSHLFRSQNKGAPQILPTCRGRNRAGPHRAAGTLLGQSADVGRASLVLFTHVHAVTCWPAPGPSALPYSCWHCITGCYSWRAGGKRTFVLCNGMSMFTNYSSKNCRDWQSVLPWPAGKLCHFILHVLPRGFKCYVSSANCIFNINTDTFGKGENISFWKKSSQEQRSLSSLRRCWRVGTKEYKK